MPSSAGSSCSPACVSWQHRRTGSWLGTAAGCLCYSLDAEAAQASTASLVRAGSDDVRRGTVSEAGDRVDATARPLSASQWTRARLLSGLGSWTGATGPTSNVTSRPCSALTTKLRLDGSDVTAQTQITDSASDFREVQASRVSASGRKSGEPFALAVSTASEPAGTPVTVAVTPTSEEPLVFS